MASSGSLLSPDQFRCSICLEVFVQPISTPCGHNFCLSCIESYWDTVPEFFCPICKHRFHRRPDLKVNTFISGLTEQLLSLQLTGGPTWSPDHHHHHHHHHQQQQQQHHQQQQQQQPVHYGSTVMCDICTDTQHEAVKSCLQCQSSYCEIHLEPHERVTGLRRHTLVQPLTSLEDRICKQHSQLLVWFCRDEEVLLCNACAGSHPPDHNVAPIDEAHTSMKTQLGTEEAEVHRRIHERVQVVSHVKEWLKHRKVETEDLKATCTQDLTALVQQIQQNQEEFLRVMEENQRAAETEAGGFMRSVEQEVMELQETVEKLKELKQTQDQLLFLQKFSVRSLRPPRTEESPPMRFNHRVETQHIRTSLGRTVSQLQTCVDNMNRQIRMFSDSGRGSTRATLRYMQQYQVDFVLDPDSAHPSLTLSRDRKQVRYTNRQATRTLKPTMFTEHLAVLSATGFTSCRFYFEVFVGSKTEWCLGVATASLQRRGPVVPRPDCGVWALWFLEDKFEPFSAQKLAVHWGKVDRVGVFVDYDGGQVSFWDVKRTTGIYSFSGCVFTEELYPYFNPCDNEYGSNLDPIKLVPVSQQD